jgi:hypothetical protein
MRLYLGEKRAKLHVQYTQGWGGVGLENPTKCSEKKSAKY